LLEWNHYAARRFRALSVHDYLLKRPRFPILPADDAGSGKTIMAGLLLRQLKPCGLTKGRRSSTR
jgi:hypothetical protein